MEQVNRQAVHANHDKKEGPFFEIQEIDETVKSRHENKGEARRQQNEGTAPEAFRDGEMKAPDQPEGDTDGPGDEQACELFSVGARVILEDFSGESAEQREADGRKLREEAEFIERTLEESAWEKRAIKPANEISIEGKITCAVAGDRDLHEGGVVSEEDPSDNGEPAPGTDVKIQDDGNKSG